MPRRIKKATTAPKPTSGVGISDLLDGLVEELERKSDWYKRLGDKEHSRYYSVSDALLEIAETFRNVARKQSNDA